MKRGMSAGEEAIHQDVCGYMFLEIGGLVRFPGGCRPEVPPAGARGRRAQSGRVGPEGGSGGEAVL